MYTGFKHLHSFTAYLALALLLFAVAYAFYSLSTNAAFTKKSKTIAMLGLIGTHVQMLIGLVLYVVSPLGLSNFSGEMMKNATSRLYAVEHPLMMLLAVVLITMGFSKAKKATEDKKRFRSIAIFYTIGLVFILSRIPWGAWWG